MCLHHTRVAVVCIPGDKWRRQTVQPSPLSLWSKSVCRNLALGCGDFFVQLCREAHTCTPTQIHTHTHVLERRGQYLSSMGNVTTSVMLLVWVLHIPSDYLDRMFQSILELQSLYICLSAQNVQGTPCYWINSPLQWKAFIGQRLLGSSPPLPFVTLHVCAGIG